MEFEIECGIPTPVGRTPRRLAKFCRRGHVRTFENVSSNGGCKLCHKLKEQERYVNLEYRESKNEKRRVKIKKERKKTHCKMGHELNEENRYENGKCILCAQLRGVLRCIEKPEVKKEEAHRYYLNNKEIVNERAKIWAIKNIDNVKEYAKNWRIENRDKTRAYTRDWDNSGNVTFKKLTKTADKLSLELLKS
jgi:hypothetical protein